MGSFIKQYLPTFLKAWRSLANAVGFVLRILPLYSIAAIIAVAAIVVFPGAKKSIHMRAWVDNSSYAVIEESEEDAILGAVLGHLDSTMNRAGRAYCVDEDTRCLSSSIEGIAGNEALPCRSIRNANQSSRMLTSELLERGALQNKTKYMLLTRRELQKVFSGHDDGWGNFHKQYPLAEGIITISRPGIDVTGTIAIVDVGVMHDWLAGSGWVHLLRKLDGQWRVERTYYTWIS